jgi:pimeloyl-ACP methyl ester carboxylesterase
MTLDTPMICVTDEALVGIHLPAIADPITYDASSVTPQERAYLDSVAAWSAAEGGYQHEQSTRPLTLGYALSDSPTGLLAWIVEKYRAWSDCGGELSSRFSDDFVLRRAERVNVPTVLAVFPADLTPPPRSWAERTYNVTRYTRMPRGGHFAAHEEPELLAHDLTEFLRNHR